MTVLLAHLSDIHITGANDPIMTRADQIVDALKNLDYGVTLGLILLSGDIAYAGKESEYLEALNLIDAIQTSLSSKLGRNGQQVRVLCIAIPGNHDCELTDIGEKRNILTTGVLKRPETATDVAVVSACIDVQENFFSFRDAVHNREFLVEPRKGLERLYYEYSISEGERLIRFLCCNTAWLSQIRERQGELLFPTDVLPERGHENDAITISAFHHPYNWLEATNARAFRKRVEKLSDLILTGHEHDSTKRTQRGENREYSAHVEGGALQDESDKASSVFNAFVLDLAERKQQFFRLVWDGTRYSCDRSVAWEEFPLNRARLREHFEVNDVRTDFLDDPGVTLTHKARSKLRLSDIFVYPDLREVPPRGTKTPDVVRGDRLIELVSKTQNILITGDTQAGKTSLAKTLFGDLLDRGYAPIYVDDSARPPKGDKAYSYLESLFVEQYDEQTLEDFKQLDRSKRAIIIDDFHLLQLPPKRKHAFLEACTQFSDYVIVFANELMHGMSALVEPDARVPFQQYRIQPFGYVQRNQLIEGWLLLDDEMEQESASFARRLTAINKDLNTLIGRNFVPAYPIYVLAVLQASESATPIDTRASTHGYFYELFIRNHLARGRNPVEFDITMAYLAHLAYRVFVARQPEISADELRTIHQDYEERHDIKRPFREVTEELCAQNILVVRNDLYRFKYKYVYYYFVAYYFRDRMHEPAVEAHIKELSQALYKEEFANILLFLAHLSKDPMIVSQLLAVAEGVFPDTTRSAMGSDVEFLNDYEDLTRKLVYEERDPATARREMHEAMDRERESKGNKSEEQEDAAKDEPEDALAPASRFNMALKTLQILGQILKNFPGSMEKENKLRIARECYNLGLKTAETAFEFFRRNETRIVKQIIDVIRAESPDINEEQLQKLARDAVIAQGKIVAYALVKRLSYSVGARDLTATYERVLKEDPVPSVRLVDASIALDHAGTFPEDKILTLARDVERNLLARWVLCLLTVEHFYLFPVDYRTKQRVCEALGIDYVRVQISDSKRKLLKR